MGSRVIPVLWLCGPPGVGKTAVGWELYSQLTQVGIEAGYVDIDQLGICYPEPASDPGRYRMKERNLDAVVASFRAAGARCVVVSGVVDPAHGVQVGQIPYAGLTVCRLRVSRDELRQRFLGRAGQTDLVEAVLSEAAAMDGSDFAHVCQDTSGLSVTEVTRLVRERTGWPALTGRRRPSEPPAPDARAPRPSTAGGQVLWLCGATGVGKSTVGWQRYEAVRRAGSTAAFVDLDQVGFSRPAPADDPDNHRVKARNLAALWDTYRAAGASRLVVVGPVRDEAGIRVYTDALPATTMTLCRLHAGRAELTRRIMLRGQGGSWQAPGDPLKGQPTTRLLRKADEAVADAGALQRAAIGDLCVHTDGRSVDEVAAEVAEAARM